MRFKDWLLQNEGLREPTPSVGRVAALHRDDAKRGRPQALPVVELPSRGMKKRMKKR